MIRKSFSVPFVFAFFLFVLAGAALPSAAAASGLCDYSYDGVGSPGPADWWQICAPVNYTCKSGTRQSPIDLPIVLKSSLPHLTYNYTALPIEVENKDGHTAEVHVEHGNYILIGQERFDLDQFHFHTPSEHKLHGQGFAMELHLVHRNSVGELAVVGVFLKEGEANRAIQHIWDHIPALPGQSVDAGDFNPALLLPASKAFYRYAGSLTTPPCSEGVRWHVLAQPVELSAAQVAQFQTFFPFNARPLQPRNNRPVLGSPF